MKTAFNGSNKKKTDGLKKEKGFRKRSSLSWMIKSRNYKDINEISASFLIDALSKSRGQGNLGWLISRVNTEKGLLDTYSLMVRRAKNLEELEKMINIKEWENVASIKSNDYKATRLGFEKLIYLYKNNKSVSDKHLGRDQSVSKSTGANTFLSNDESTGDTILDNNLLQPSIERLTVAGMVMKAVCIEMKKKGELLNYKQLLSVFEGGLVPYYFPLGEDIEDRIGSLILMFEGLLNSPSEVNIIDRPTQNMIYYMLDNGERELEPKVTPEEE